MGNYALGLQTIMAGVFFTLRARAAVTIYATSYNITNTDSNTDFDIVVVVGFNPGEVDVNILTWESTTRTPTFEFYYDTVTTDGGVVFSNAIKWNELRTIEERKQANGTVLITALLNNNPVGSDTFVISIHWHPENSSVLLNYPGDNIVRGSQLTLTCKCSDKGNPTGHVVWLKDNTTTIEEIFQNNVVTLDEITADYNGDWSCYHENAIGSGTVSSTEKVEVMGAPFPSSLASDPNGDSIIRGSTLILTCSCLDKGNPPGLVVWVMNGTVMTGDMFNSDVIVINSVTTADNGEWECYYENDIGKGKPSNSETVNVIWTPGRPESPSMSQMIILKGSTLSLDCRLQDKGNPVGWVTWTLNASDTPYTNDKLTIMDASDTETGQWGCYYRNVVGKGLTSAFVQVKVEWQPSSANLVLNPSSGKIYIGFALTLTCWTIDKGIPPGSVLWGKDDVLKNGSEFDSDVLQLKEVTRNDTGSWYCNYRNDHGSGSSATKHIDVILKPEPQVWIIIVAAVCAVLLVVCIIGIIIAVVKRKKKKVPTATLR